MKHVYIARHAEAAPTGVNGVMHDFDRPLTDHGLSLLKQQACGLKQLNIFFFNHEHRLALLSSAHNVCSLMIILYNISKC